MPCIRHTPVCSSAFGGDAHLGVSRDGKDGTTMLEDPMPGAALEAPETFQILPASLWPRLPVAAGYPGTARWVAPYMSGDHVMYHDGTGAGTGDTGLFLAFKRHQVIAPHLAGTHLGS